MVAIQKLAKNSTEFNDVNTSLMNVKRHLVRHRIIKPLVAMALSFLLTTACYSPNVRNSNTPISNPSDCRVIQHQLGEVCIPNEPKRIIALEPGLIVDPLLALGIRPIGMATFSNLQGEEDLAGLTSDDVEGIVKVGDVMQPSLERILNLKPDLILGMYFHENVYSQLSAIAPTVLVKDQEYEPIKKNLRYLAQVFNRDAASEKLLSQYQARISELREKLNHQPQEIEVTVLIHYGGNFLLPGTWHASHEVFSDIGLSDNVSENPSPISVEVLDQYDADILFISDYDAKPESFFLQNPLISSLNAVKNNQAHIIDASGWHAGGILGLNRMLDNLFRYLPQVK